MVPQLGSAARRWRDGGGAKTICKISYFCEDLLTLCVGCGLLQNMPQATTECVSSGFRLGVLLFPRVDRDGGLSIRGSHHIRVDIDCYYVFVCVCLNVTDMRLSFDTFPIE